MARWKKFADWAKHRPAVLQLADRLGRSRGRLALLDHVAPPPAARRPDLKAFLRSSFGAILIGHSTILLRLNGTTILTDPVFWSRVGIGLGLLTAGPKRRFAPALSIEQLPPVDLILLSHAHFDHLDRPTLARLRSRPTVITSTGTSDLLTDLGYRQIHELRPGEQTIVGPLSVKAIPALHWGARVFHDSHRGYNAYEIDAVGDGPNRRVLFGGDTAYHEQWQDLPPVDLAILGIGGYNPFIQGHANPEQAWAMANHVRAASVLPMHWGTFSLSHEPWTEPMERFHAAVGNETDRVALSEIGGMWIGE